MNPPKHVCLTVMKNIMLVTNRLMVLKINMIPNLYVSMVPTILHPKISHEVMVVSSRAIIIEFERG